jgi:hypothetical protein
LDEWHDEAKPVWSHKVLKRIVKSDVYKPNTYEEEAELVAPQIAAALAPNKKYGIRWNNKYEITGHTVTEPDGGGGRRYKKRTITMLRSKDEWVAVPVLAYLPRSLEKQAAEHWRRTAGALRGSTWREAGSSGGSRAALAARR